MGVLSESESAPHGKQSIKRDSDDDLLDWPVTKDKDIFQKVVDLQQEVLALSQAKKVTEKELLSMPVIDYYVQVEAFIKWSKRQEELMKGAN